MKVYLIPNSGNAKAKTIAAKAADILLKSGAECFYDMNMCGYEIPGCINADHAKILKTADAAISIGGDGTLLHMASELIDGIPFMGINVGRLGFLTEIEAQDIEKLSRLTKGEYTVEKRRVLEAYIPSCKKSCFAINEFVLCSIGAMKTINLDVKCDNDYVNRYRGDGVIVATPTGSTAYSLSAGGPIVDADISCMIVSPICAHSLNTPPMVFSKKRKLVIHAEKAENAKIKLLVDGCAEMDITEKDKIEITLSDKSIGFIRLGESSQFSAIDKKLRSR